MQLVKGLSKLLGSSSARKKVLDYLDASLRWEDNESATFDLHFNFGKVSLDRSNRVVDRVRIKTD